MMKIAVYSICKNESAEVEDWLESTKDADIRLVVDTGSVDNTDMMLMKGGAQVFSAAIRPWRFDDALNTSLSLIHHSIDVCFRVDMDERPHKGWRDVIEKEFTDETTILRYPYHWSPQVTFYSDRIHRRHGYRWRGATHEGLVWRGEGNENPKWINNLEVSHFQKQKSRPNDLALLKEAATEYPNDARLCLYYGRELVWKHHKEEAIRILRHFINLSTAQCDVSYAYRLLSTVDEPNALSHLQKALKIDPTPSNELALADFYYDKDWALCYQHTENTIRKLSPIGNWSDDLRLKTGYPYDIGTIAAWKVGNIPLAILHVQKALEFLPNDERLLSNLEILQKL